MTIWVEVSGSEQPPSMELTQIRNATGESIALTPVGARLVEAHFPDRASDFADIVTERRYALQHRRDAPVLSGDGLTTCRPEADGSGKRRSEFSVARQTVSVRTRTVACGWRSGRLAKFATSARKETCWLW